VGFVVIGPDEIVAACLQRIASRMPDNAEVAQLALLRAWDRGATPTLRQEAIANAVMAFSEQGAHDLARRGADLLDARFAVDKALADFRAGDSGAVPRRRLLLVTNIGRLPSEAANARQETAVREMERVAHEDGAVLLLNVAAADELEGREGWCEEPLERDARDVVGPQCRPIPIARDIFAIAVRVAEREGIDHVAYLNSDILPTHECLFTLRLLAGLGFETTGFARTDLERAGDRQHPDRWKGLHLSGTDLLSWRTDWWRRFGHQFEDYVLGAYWWDNVFVGIAMVHGRFYYASQQRGAIFHVAHETISRFATPQADHNLTLRDDRDHFYFSMQDRYCDQLRAYLKRNRSMPNATTNAGLVADKFLQGLKRRMA